MKKGAIFVILLVAISGMQSCSYFTPQVSKALSEEKRLAEMKKQSDLMQEQNIQLHRIADALEKASYKK